MPGRRAAPAPPPDPRAVPRRHRERAGVRAPLALPVCRINTRLRLPARPRAAALPRRTAALHALLRELRAAHAGVPAVPRRVPGVIQGRLLPGRAGLHARPLRVLQPLRGRRGLHPARAGAVRRRLRALHPACRGSSATTPATSATGWSRARRSSPSRPSSGASTSATAGGCCPPTGARPRARSTTSASSSRAARAGVGPRPRHRDRRVQAHLRPALVRVHRRLPRDARHRVRRVVLRPRGRRAGRGRALPDRLGGPRHAAPARPATGEEEIPYRTISPRHLEAAAFRVCQILFEGRYAGLLEPMVHYIPLRKDFSNLDEVLDRFRDADLRAQIAENAYRDLIASRRAELRALRGRGRRGPRCRRSSAA